MPGKKLPDALIDRLTREGKTDREILEYLEKHENIVTTRQALSIRRRRRGDGMRPAVTSSIPWKLRQEHTATEPARAIRWHARREAGLPLSPTEERRLDRVVDHLAEVGGVLHYDPNLPDGWVIVPRREGVDTGIVRDPKVA